MDISKRLHTPLKELLKYRTLNDIEQDKTLLIRQGKNYKIVENLAVKTKTQAITYRKLKDSKRISR
jgi:hypothetical protein